MQLIQRWKRAAMYAAGAWIAVTVSCQPTSIDLSLGPDGWYSGSVVVESTRSNGDCHHNDDEFELQFNFSGYYDGNEHDD